ncbi:Mitogen-activated protein kinase kinase kinase 3 [Platanthera guangdongensis]|uniref:Mitogen-activated protein kinase kinase kinase 3 n=1 Tax=Platanthera guangdongensis TaxID=2320717 RepID=A0ABR2M9Q8_9ASPA
MLSRQASDSTIYGGLIELARLRSTCGAFGHVYMGMNLDSGELLAVKQNDEETDPFGAEREDMKMEKLRRFEASSMDDDLKLSVCREIGSSSNRLEHQKFFNGAAKAAARKHCKKGYTVRGVWLMYCEERAM